MGEDGEGVELELDFDDYSDALDFESFMDRF